MYSHKVINSLQRQAVVQKRKNEENDYVKPRRGNGVPPRTEAWKSKGTK